MAASTRRTLSIHHGPKYSYLYQVAKSEKPTFLLLHGFLGSSYDWRKQIADLGAAGYGVLAPDLLGYGETDKPDTLDAYTFSNISRHVVKILEHEKLTQLPGALDLDGINALTEGLFGYTMFGYWKFFNESDAVSFLEAHHESFSTIMYQSDPEIIKSDFCSIGKLKEWIQANKTAALPSWLPKKEFEEHQKIVAKGGYTDPSNWYKCIIRDIDPDADATISQDAIVINKPTLFLVGDSDTMTRPEVLFQAAEQGKMGGWLPNVEVQTVPGSHFFNLEQPKATFDILDAFAKSL